jgi:hypothetical protein
MQIFTLFGNNDNENKSMHVWCRGNFHFPNIFDPWLVEFTDVEATYVEGQLYFQVFKYGLLGNLFPRVPRFL